MDGNIFIYSFSFSAGGIFYPPLFSLFTPAPFFFLFILFSPRLLFRGGLQKARGTPWQILPSRGLNSQPDRSTCHWEEKWQVGRSVACRTSALRTKRGHQTDPASGVSSWALSEAR